MKKAVLAISLLAFSAPFASACEFQRSAQAKEDKTVVASVASEQNLNMSTPALPTTNEPVQTQETDQN
ncbi:MULTISPECIES: hypothetical protein [Mesorhizobium]|uniref:Uncharacterized protein n=1 Tax=Mesorhizobium denitrificans TaxID=2294114 RepID=A0A371XGS3_9HYPH|nr:MULTISPECIES: hypothetical protein [Mesorhizobium]RFC68427.1 hypothetical protein DY251_05485 [Mesorhizobium denitrificans]